MRENHHQTKWLKKRVWSPYHHCQGGAIPEHAVMVNSSTEGVARTGQSQPRASVVTSLSENKDCVQNITTEKMKTGYVTVNGVNLMDLQRLRKSSDRKTTVKKNNTPQRSKKNLETTVPSSGSIKKYFIKKTKDISGTVMERREGDKDKDTKKTTLKTGCGDEEVRSKTGLRQTDNVVVNDECAEEAWKETFSDIDTMKKKSVKEIIRMFQDLVDDGDCVIGGGWCGKHHVKLVRNVSKKKISSVSEDGGTTWLRG